MLLIKRQCEAVVRAPSQTACLQRRSWLCPTASRQSRNQGPLHQLNGSTRTRCEIYAAAIWQEGTQNSGGFIWYLKWPAQPLWGSPSLLLFHSQWPRDAPEALGTAGYSSKQMPCGKGRETEWDRVRQSDFNQVRDAVGSGTNLPTRRNQGKRS